MAEREIYHLDIVIGVQGDESSKKKISALDRYFEQTQKRANILDKMAVSPSARINDKATSRIEKINSTLSKLNRLVASPTVMIKDKVSGSLSIMRSGINKVISAATSLQGVLLGVGGTWAGIIKPMQLSGDFEQTQIAFTTMLKSAEQANSFLTQAQNMANATPFEFPQLADASKKMLAFGWDVKSILPDLATIGDAASGLGLGAEGINQITLALGQMKAKGRVQGDEMLQQTEAGVPATKILQEQLGMTAEQVANIGDAGVDADKAIKALLTGMDKRFGGMMQNQAKTALGLMSTLKDTLDNKFLTQWGNGLWTGIKPGLTKVTTWLDKNDKKVTELGKLFRKAGENVSTFIGGGLEKSQQRLSKLMDSSQWKNADFGGKITLAWDKVIAEPLSSWWSGDGRPKINKVASEMGSSIGSVLGGGIIAVLDAFSGGDDINKTGNTAGKSFLDAFLKAFNTDEIIKKLLTAFKDANLNAVKNPNAESITKAMILDYGLYAAGGGAIIKGGAKAAKGAFKLGKWAVGKKGAKTASNAAEEMAGTAGSASKASSTSSKASKPFSEEINRLKSNVDKAREEAKFSGRNANTKKDAYNKARDTFKSTRNADNTSDLKKAASDFRKAVNESANAEKLRKINQDKLNKAIKEYNDFVKKSKDVKNVGKDVSEVTRMGSGLSKVGKVAKKVPLLGAGLTLAGAGIDIATASDKKKATVGAAGNIAGGLVGMKAGATIGGTIGSIFGPVGTAVGAGVGGIAGGIAGSIGGEKALDWVYDKTGPAVNYLKKGFGNAKKSVQTSWNNFGTWFGNKVGTPLKNGAINTINFTVGAFAMGKDAAARAWAPYGQWLSNNVFTPIKNKASETGKWVGDKVGEGKTWASNKWSDFSTWWGTNVSEPVKGYASSAGQWIGERFNDAKSTAHTAWTGFSGWWSENIGEPTKSVATTVGDWIGSKLSSGRKTVETTWSNFSTWFKEHIGGPAYALLEKVMTKGESVTGLHTKANGGIVNGPEVTLIGEAGTEAVIPLSSSRRNRGLSLWQQAGRMLGVRMFANGGIVGSGSTGTGKVAKATANISTSIALGDDALTQFKKYGNKINDNLSSGILDNKKVSTNSVNRVTNESGSILNLFSKTGHVYGVAINNDIASGIQSSMGNVTSMVKTLTDKVIAQFKEGFGIRSPSRVFYKLTQFIPQGMINSLKDSDIGNFIKNWIGDITSMAGGAMSGNVSGWLSAALAVTGTPMSWLPGLLRLVQAESGGNPLAYNSISVGGEHATGLLQTLPSTFREFMVKGLNNILNPVHNAAAAINYIKSRYGSVFNTPLFKGGSYAGYATGTDNAKKGLARINERGWEFVDFTGGEKVLNHMKSVGLMERAANSINMIKSAVSGLNSTGTENKDIPENLSYYTSQPQVAMAGTSYGDINIDVENNFSSDPDIDTIVIQATKKFATELKKQLQNIKR